MKWQRKKGKKAMVVKKKAIEEKPVVKLEKHVVKVESPVEVKPVEPVVSGPKCVECGAPVAPGQNYVCVKHQRTN